MVKEYKEHNKPKSDASEFEIKEYFRDLDKVRKNKEKCETNAAAFLMFSCNRCTELPSKRLGPHFRHGTPDTVSRGGKVRFRPGSERCKVS